MGSMTRTEWQAWASVAGLAAVYWWFQMRMLDGFQVVDQSAARLLGVFMVVIALSTLAEILIAMLGAGGGKVAKDERDFAIEARANQNERLFIIAAVSASSQPVLAGVLGTVGAMGIASAIGIGNLPEGGKLWLRPAYNASGLAGLRVFRLDAGNNQ